MHPSVGIGSDFGVSSQYDVRPSLEEVDDVQVDDTVAGHIQFVQREHELGDPSLMGPKAPNSRSIVSSVASRNAASIKHILHPLIVINTVILELFVLDILMFW